jgi:pimeloyl-ACP methyl ester carboxylesterase
MTTTRHFQHKTKDGLIDIAYQMSGEGPPLLLLHGFPQTKIIWRKIRTELSKNYSRSQRLWRIIKTYQSIRSLQLLKKRNG